MAQAFKLPKGWNKRMYYWYVVDVDGERKRFRAKRDGIRLSYDQIIKHYKDQGAKKVWVVKEFKDYYRVFC